MSAKPMASAPAKATLLPPDSLRRNNGPNCTQIATISRSATSWAMRDVFAITAAIVMRKTLVHIARIHGWDPLAKARITNPELNGHTRFKNAPALP
jgi:hypothetical protein